MCVSRAVLDNFAPHIIEESYYKHVFEFIERGLRGLPFHLKIVGESYFMIIANKKIRFLRLLPNVELLYTLSVVETMDAMLGCDLLFQTGSSFSAAPLWLSDMDRPIILESIAKETYMLPYVLDRFQLPEGRSVRIDETGTNVNIITCSLCAELACSGHCLQDLGEDYLLNRLVDIDRVAIVDGVPQLVGRQ